MEYFGVYIGLNFMFIVFNYVVCNRRNLGKNFVLRWVIGCGRVFSCLWRI